MSVGAPAAPLAAASPLALAGIVKRYGSHTALAGVDLAVASGQIVALLGPNGAGKSTLVGIAAGLLTPDAGSAQACGRDPRADRHALGLAPQEIGIYPSLTVRENLRAFGEAHGLSAARARRRADSLLAPFALEALADRAAGRLSGGEQRRLHTAAALVNRPRIVLLDEPTAGADTHTREAILAAVRDLAATGTAVVYTTHYLPEVEALGADVALLEAGRIIASGPVAELVARHAESTLEVTFFDGRVVRRPGASLHGLEHDVVRAEIIHPSLEAAYLALTGRRSAAE